MLRRLLLIFLPSLTTSLAHADESAWHCQQDPEQGWVCGGQNKPTQSLESKVIPPQVNETLKTEQPVISPIENTAQKANKSLKNTTPTPTSEPTFVTPAKTEETINKTDGIVTKQENNIPPNTTSQTNNNSQTPATDITKNNINYVKSDVLESFRFNIFKPAFNSEQESIFNNLTNRLNTDPWQNCTVQNNKFIAPSDNSIKRKTSPLDVESNYSEILDNEIGIYTGKVKMQHADQSAQSESANYDSVSETLNLQGGVYYSEDQLAFYSNAATLQLATDQAKLRDTLFIVPSLPLRGSAKAIYRDNKDLSRYTGVNYTSCRPNNQDWIIHADELKVNRESGKGSAKNAWLEFKGLPLFYSPYLSFPVDNRRLSGFLAPNYNFTQNSGFGFAIPYYFNLNPQYDATFTPHYLEKRGFLLGTNFRYLSEHTLNSISVDYMPDDA